MKTATAAKNQCKRPVYPILRNMNRSSRYRWLSVLALLYCLPGLAATVYKSINEEGVVSFSDTLPQHDTLVETVVIDNRTALPNEQGQKNLQDMRETTDRMIADRMAREKHRAEMRELQAQTEAMQGPEYPDYPDYYDSRTVYSGYYDYLARRNWRRPGHVRPEHPIVRPPLRPPVDKFPPGARPSSVSNFPAPHIRPLFTPRVRGSSR